MSESASDAQARVIAPLLKEIADTATPDTPVTGRDAPASPITTPQAEVQVVFPAVDNGYVSSGLYELSKVLGSRDPDAQSHGVLGGEWGYGQDFTNDVFTMFPFWWGDCECGFDESEAAWCDEHRHSDGCFHTRYMAFHDSLARPWSDEGQKASMDWLEARGISSSYGIMLRCDCGNQVEWEAWRAVNGHDDRCPTVRPNFVHFASGLEVRWYKYIGRDTEANRDAPMSEWSSILDDCLRSLGDPAGDAGASSATSEQAGP